MTRDEFIDNLRIAYRSLPPPRVSSGKGKQQDRSLSAALHSADLWLTSRSVEGFDAADFTELSHDERTKLKHDVAEFLAIAKKVAPNKPATKEQSKLARARLEAIINTVGQHILSEWITAQNQMIGEAAKSAKSRGWSVEQDEKTVQESLLGEYKAPRLVIRTHKNHDVVLDPVARFGSGGQGVVDLVTMPGFDTVYLVVFKNDTWSIVSPFRTMHSRPFNSQTFISTITALSKD